VPEPLLKLLELCLLALLWLFFLRVLRAVWTEVRGPSAVPAPRASSSNGGGGGRRPSGRGKRGQPRLVVVEPKDRRGRAFTLQEEQTVGRAAGCQITLDDTYISQLHARVFQRDGTWFVEDLGSTNGTYLNTKRVSTTPLAVKRGDQIKIGAVVMEAEV
jgi:pSer/pThr/pTyr-binding forkhead associated (FHA) protein